MTEWKITQIKVAQTPEPNTVTELEYTATLQNVTRSGSVPLGPPGPTFVNYSDLTEEICLQWLWEKVTKEGTEDVLNKLAQQQQADLPWNVQEENE